MTCIRCNIHSGKFITAKDYQIFLNKLNMLIDQGIIKKIENSSKKKSLFYEDEYICLKCNQKWQLLAPDQAFRGGWNVKE